SSLPPCPRTSLFPYTTLFRSMGRWLRHCGYYPSWNLRLFRHAAGRYEKLLTTDTGSGDNEIHEHLTVSGRTGYLQNDMLHLAYPDRKSTRLNSSHQIISYAVF